MKLPAAIQQFLPVKKSTLSRPPKTPRVSLFDPSRRKALVVWTVLILLLWMGVGVLSSVVYKKFGAEPTTADIENLVRDTLHVAPDQDRFVE